MGDRFRSGESFGFCILIFCPLPPYCFHSFFVWLRFCISFVDNCLCALCHGTKKMLIFINGFAFIYKCIFLVIIFEFSLLVVLFFSSSFCVRNRRKYVMRFFPWQKN